MPLRAGAFRFPELQAAAVVLNHSRAVPEEINSQHDAECDNEAFD